MSSSFKCGRCGKMLEGESEVCWFCMGPLCGTCWEEHGHCGHPQADEANEKARKFHIPEGFKALDTQELRDQRVELERSLHNHA